MNRDQIRDALLAGLAAAGALVVEHYTLQHGENELKPPISYIVGIATVGIPFTWWAQRHKMMPAAWAYWALFGIGGAATVATYLLDEYGEPTA